METRKVTISPIPIRPLSDHSMAPCPREALSAVFLVLSGLSTPLVLALQMTPTEVLSDGNVFSRGSGCQTKMLAGSFPLYSLWE